MVLKDIRNILTQTAQPAQPQGIQINCTFFCAVLAQSSALLYLKIYINHKSSIKNNKFITILDEENKKEKIKTFGTKFYAMFLGIITLAAAVVPLVFTFSSSATEETSLITGKRLIL